MLTQDLETILQAFQRAEWSGEERLMDLTGAVDGSNCV